MLKSFLNATTYSIVIGILLSGIFYVNGMDVNLDTVLICCGISFLAVAILTIRNYFQERSLNAKRALLDLRQVNDPLMAVVNSDESLCFECREMELTSDFFKIEWVLNSITFDYNTSILLLVAQKKMTSAEARKEVNRIARQYCGGNFFRTQTVGVIIRNAGDELSAKPVIANSFSGHTGIIWAICVHEAERTIDDAKTHHTVRTDGIFLGLLNWFLADGFKVASDQPGNPLFGQKPNSSPAFRHTIGK